MRHFSKSLNGRHSLSLRASLPSGDRHRPCDTRRFWAATLRANRGGHAGTHHVFPLPNQDVLPPRLGDWVDTRDGALRRWGLGCSTSHISGTCRSCASVTRALFFVFIRPQDPATQGAPSMARPKKAHEPHGSKPGGLRAFSVGLDSACEVGEEVARATVTGM